MDFHCVLPGKYTCFPAIFIGPLPLCSLGHVMGPGAFVRYLLVICNANVSITKFCCDREATQKLDFSSCFDMFPSFSVVNGAYAASQKLTLPQIKDLDFGPRGVFQDAQKVSETRDSGIDFQRISAISDHCMVTP